MKEERILNVLGQVDEQFIEEAAPGKQAAGAHSRVKWAVLAACLVLALVLAGIGLPYFGRSASGSQTESFDQPEQMRYYKLPEQLRQQGFLAEAVDASAGTAGREMPYISKKEMIKVLKAADALLNCTVEEMDLIRVRSAGSDQTGSLTLMTLSLNGMIRGNAQEDHFSTVNISVSNTEEFLFYPGLEDCKAGTRAVFILRRIGESDAVRIGDSPLALKELGEYSVVYCLEYDGEVFRFMNYEIPVTELD
ncbi:MAG: hypothetical protein J5496_03930 [Lachnospiraceae bacterium]|nr:hypothetical protein [Lachnospiraceae bacterium]